MKKTLITLFIAAGVFASVSAQTEREKGVLNRKGYQVLPQKGDMAIGIDANPFLNYAANLFRGGDAPGFNAFEGSLYTKYFIENNRAIRMRLLIGVNSNSVKFEVPDDAARAATPPDLEAKVTDRRRINQTLFGLYGGYECRRGYGRLQGYMGGEMGFFVASEKASYKWGNGFGTDNTTATSVYDWGSGGYLRTGTRDLWTKSGTTFSIQAGLFAGVEYFFARKVSIGGELGLNLRMTTTGQGKTQTETFDIAGNKVVTKVTDNRSKGDTDWDFSTPVNGNIFLMFHF